MRKKIRLFCLPYAGGSSSAFYKWSSHLNSSIELCPLELSGRGERFGSELFDNIDDIVEDLFVTLKKELEESVDFDYAFFGHSLGTILAYELMRKIQQNNYKEPIHIFMSGRFPPHKEELKYIHNLPDDQFIDEIIKLGGMPDTLVQNKEILDLFTPVLKSDYTAVETYKYTESDKWNFDISILMGNEDEEVKHYDFNEWTTYTNNKCNFFMFNGDHFFINDNITEITDIINKILI